METLVVIGLLIAVVWYLVARDDDGGSSTDLRAPPPHARPRYESPQSSDRTTRTPDRSGGPRSMDSPFARQIQAAIDANRDIHFRYSDAKGSVTYRTIRPHQFVQYEFTHGEGRSLCVQGHCRLRDESRTFALRRMSELQTL